MPKPKSWKLELTILSIIIAVIALVTTFSTIQPEPQPLPAPTPKAQPEPKLSFVAVYEDDLIEDMKRNYPNISIKTKAEIIKAILDESKRYDINPLILYSICHVESSFQHWIEHSSTTIEIEGKKRIVRAVGLGGIIWEWWGTQLKDAGIAEVRSDLFNPVTNIKATAYIYNEHYKMPKLKGADTHSESALLRHFGGNFPTYFQKIDTKIAEFVKPNLYK